MRKDEKYIKELLAKNFKGVGNFQRFEYQMYAGSSRPDFVILEDNHFTYFEIKSEFDNFSRLVRQMEGTKGFFTKYFLVIPEKTYDDLYNKENRQKNLKIIRLINTWGVYVLEDLELWFIEPRKPSIDFKIWVENLGLMLWKEEKKVILKKKQKEFWHKKFLLQGFERTLTSLGAYDMDLLMPVYIRKNEVLSIINDVFSTRDFDIFKWK